ncbi:hypothetical protein [Ureaplasma canigenitalium]|uniref:hypothetical protein n=1 Tax=Ureaplasma canigenitalium TaxID=42092 RepID=UPI0004E1720F|nr:hypothetical protein [Ureaplasma canigenitalium]
MKELNLTTKQELVGGFAAASGSFNSYMWNKAMVGSVLGSTISGFFSTIAQMVYAFNEEPAVPHYRLIDNTAARIYARVAPHPSRSTLSFGSPFF